MIYDKHKLVMRPSQQETNPNMYSFNCLLIFHLKNLESQTSVFCYHRIFFLTVFTTTPPPQEYYQTCNYNLFHLLFYESTNILQIVVKSSFWKTHLLPKGIYYSPQMHRYSDYFSLTIQLESMSLKDILRTFFSPYPLASPVVIG